MTVTDSASAARYGLQAASLSRAGDDAAPSNRVFVAPDTASLLAGEQAMSAELRPRRAADRPVDERRQAPIR